MRNRLGIITLAVLFIFCFQTPSIAAKKILTVEMKKGEARVGMLIGNAQVASKDRISGRLLKKDDVLRGGDDVVTGPGSRLEVILPDASTVRFNENTHFKIKEMHYGEQNTSRNVRIHMTLGKAWANVVKASGGKSRFELGTENAVAGVRGTVYRMNVEKDRSSLIKVYDGQVYVSGGGKSDSQGSIVEPPRKIAGPRAVPGPRKVSMEEWTFLIKAMQQINIKGNGMPDKPTDFTADEDREEWVEWNRLRDQEEDHE